MGEESLKISADPKWPDLELDFRDTGSVSSGPDSVLGCP